LLRPGRFDRLLYVPSPDRDSRIQIIKIHTKKKPLADDVDIEKLADHTDRYAVLILHHYHLQQLCLLALRDHISKYKDPKEADNHTQELKIHMRHFEDAIKKVRPLSTQELNMYKGIADQFGKSELRSTTMGQLLIIKVLYQAIVSTKIMRSSSFLQYYCMLYNLQSIKKSNYGFNL
jgi:transitional endoplasmic reticulum ATPase